MPEHAGADAALGGEAAGRAERGAEWTTGLARSVLADPAGAAIGIRGASRPRRWDALPPAGIAGQAAGVCKAASATALIG